MHLIVILSTEKRLNRWRSNLKKFCLILIDFSLKFAPFWMRIEKNVQICSQFQTNSFCKSILKKFNSIHDEKLFKLYPEMKCSNLWPNLQVSAHHPSISFYRTKRFIFKRTKWSKILKVIFHCCNNSIQ